MDWQTTPTWPVVPPLPMLGERVGHWLVIAPASPRHRRAHWRCQCQVCSGEAVISGNNLRRSGKTGVVRPCRRCGKGKA